MGCLRPATPGFIVTLVATILLVVVVFCVPYFKSVFFLKATITVDNISGSVTFGTLGYCLELPGNVTCSKPSIGYELDINALVGNKLPVEIPQVAVKWLTYALFLHVVALIGAAGSAVFGLLAHVREMSMTCCSTFVSGFAAVVCMLAFIFDLVLFFIAKARINAVGTAEIGNAIWLTLAAWLLLFFSGCFYTLGRCCISKRPSSSRDDKYGGGASSGGGRWNSGRDAEAAPTKDYGEQLRLDAVKAEADRKARVKQQEVGLPAFHETQPLTGRVEGDHVYLDNEPSESSANLPAAAAPPARQQQGGGYSAGYVQGAPGTRAMDDYYNPQPSPGPNTYPPQPHQHPTRQPSFAASTYSTHLTQSPPMQTSPPPLPSQTPYYNAQRTTSPPPSSQQFLTPGAYTQDAYGQSGRDYGHTAGGSSYHTASSQHGQQPSAYTQYDPYAATPTAPTPYQQPYSSYQDQSYADPYSSHPLNTGPTPAATAYGQTPNPYMAHSSSPPPQIRPERNYTLGGDGYGSNQLPPLQESTPAGYYGYTSSPPSEPQQPTSPIRGPRPQPGVGVPEDSPPGYEPSNSGVTGNWGKR
ncbi:hypothetical protein CVT24_008887 [Panaeolus cyanescens]|uniref:Pali-domain-containing protein n=1 Tax=Panaeolus cyanescens TaxID=181874 RepID=A0A409VAX2_9AGAR|nr:hypothetical protein CVT24_008887 [Panaeolus cyanescens]